MTNDKPVKNRVNRDKTAGAGRGERAMTGSILAGCSPNASDVV